jgi:hypothetical protein
MVNRKLFQRPAIILVTVSAILLLAASHFSQTQRRPPLQGGVSKSGQQSGDVFNSNSRPSRNCKPDDCPCQSAQAVEFAQQGCKEQLADFDEKIQEREAEIREINAYPAMQGKKKLNPATDPNILLYRRHKEEYKIYCDCIKKLYKDMCSLSGAEWQRRQAECTETGGTPYRPYPPERGSKGAERRDPLGLPPAYADTPPAPEILYKPDCRRSLVFINNPEQITKEDLADVSLGHKHIYETRINKAARIFFEHTNRTGSPIGYDIQLVNPNEKAVQVIINGKGFITDVHGGEPFRQVFEQERSRQKEQVLTIDAKKYAWVFQSEQPKNLKPKPPAIQNRAFLSGVVDLEVRGGPIVIKAMGYGDINDLDGRSTAEGYIKRLDQNPKPPPTDESRLYKGIMDCAEVIADKVNFTIDNSTADGPLDIRFRSRDGELNELKQWHTHSVSNPSAIQSDMMDIRMPGGTVIRADGLDEKRRPPNIGNWGVVYTLKGEVTNNGNESRCVSINLKLTSPREMAVIAWRDRGGIWHQKQLPVKGGIAYYEFTVPAGQVLPYEAKVVLGGPSSTNLLNWFSLAGKKQSCQGTR